ncbi:hypothetical protein O6H91_11G104700 [Diphasiastrum complanatum]|uniref:Uncharacterized protein n=1 Tax=Diphasiastrum complanatum TaxID=34168 RepID=A0ACC2CC65_DIPCM|nr:hypothetical protein O6H91_11G104700 [Diphasiastrum complanatum]
MRSSLVIVLLLLDNSRFLPLNETRASWLLPFFLEAMAMAAKSSNLNPYRIQHQHQLQHGSHQIHASNYVTIQHSERGIGPLAGVHQNQLLRFCFCSFAVQQANTFLRKLWLADWLCDLAGSTPKNGPQI